MDGQVVVEGHPKWLEDLAASIEERAKQDNESMGSFCARLLEKNEDKLTAGLGWNEWSGVFAHKLNSIAVSLLKLDDHGGNSKLLMLKLDMMLVEPVEQASENQREVIFYCRKVLKWKLDGGTYGDKTAKYLINTWNALVSKGNEVKAMIAFLKGNLALELGVELEKVQRLYLEAIGLDGKCLEWYNHAYLIAREIRQGKYSPTKLEQELAETAYNISAGQNDIAAANYAIMCQEFWMGNSKHFWGENQEMYLRCVQYLENSLNFADGRWKISIRILLADFLFFGKRTEDDEIRGLGILLELERKYPGSVSVAHRIVKRYYATFHINQANYGRVLALNTGPQPAPCLQDYVKCLNLKLRVGQKTKIATIVQLALLKNPSSLDEDNGKLQVQLDSIMKKIEGIHRKRDEE